MPISKQIIAMGGGGFSMEPDNPLLDDYILKQSDKANPRVCFVATASGDSEAYINRFYKAFNAKPCIPNHLSLFKGHTPDIESFILEQDIIYVGGGNMRNMLVLWREWDLDQILKTAYEQGIVLCGISAGSMCWFEEGLSDSVPLQLNRLPCLGFLEGSNCPHFDGESERQLAYKEKVKSGEMKAGIACDDGVALHFVDGKLEEIVASNEHGFAYRFGLKEGKLEEEKLVPTRLSSRKK